MNHLVDLSHTIHIGMHTHPGLPGPAWEAFRSRDYYRELAGTEFQVDQVTLIGNTGTYLDSPFHRFPAGGDLASLPLAAVADLPIVLVDARGQRAVNESLLEAHLGNARLAATAVLLHTGSDAHWGTEAYAESAPFLTAGGAKWLADRQPALVGIDAVNIDDLDDTTRPAHTRLLAENILILEHLTRLSELPERGARLHAAPPAWREIGTWMVRAYAVLHETS